MRKFYYRLDKNLNEAIIEYKEKFQKSKNLKFVIVISDKDILSSTNAYESIIKILKENNIEPHNIVVAIKSNKRNFDQDEWNKIVEISKSLTKNGVKFGFEDHDKIFSVDQVQNANSKIVSTSNDIKKQNLSPYEKLLMSYLKVTSRKYVSEDEVLDHSADSRSVYGVLNSEKIVCVGFAEWLKNVLLELEDTNIKVFNNEVSCSDDNKSISAYHENLIIYIKDDKYKIDGYYYLDPTWDCGHQDIYLPHLTYFMVPLKDIDKIKHHIRSYEHSGLIEDEEITTKRATKKQRTENTSSIRKESTDMISFSSDKFDFTKEFLHDLLSSNPKLFERIKEELNENKLFNLYEAQDKVDRHKNLLEKMKIFIEELDLQFISEDKKWDLSAIVKKCCQNGNIDKFKKFEQDLKNEFSNKKTINKKSFVQCFKSYVEELIKSTKEQIKLLENSRKEKYEQSIKDYIENKKLFNFNNEEIDENQLRVEYIQENPIADHWRTWEINEAKESIEQLKAGSSKISKQLESMFKTYPELEECLKFIDEEEAKNIITKNIYDFYIKEGSANIEFIVSSIKNHYRPLDQIKIIEKELKDSIEKEKEIDSALQYTLEESLDEIVSKVMFNDRCKELIEKYLKKHSSVVDLNMLSRAMTQILKKTHEREKEKIYDYVKRVIDHNCDIVLSRYEDTAINSFVQYALTYNQEMF